MKGGHISLIGMSNTGKSFWAGRLAARGFRVFSCDDIIEARLASRLESEGLRGIRDVARWMGQPYAREYRDRAARYLAEEKKAMKEAIDLLRESPAARTVVDTTGSVVYVGESVLEELRRASTVVLLDAPERIQEKLYKEYMAKPKPVIWGSAFKPLPGESPKEALARCYPLLLKARNARYHRFADVVLEYDELRAPSFTAADFLRRVRNARR